MRDKRTSLWLTVAAAFAIAACAGIQARERVLMPAMEKVWVNVQEDVNRGIVLLGREDLRPEVERMSAALKSGIPARLKEVDWHSLRLTAMSGIELRNDLTDGVRAVLLRRLAKFHESYLKVIQ